MSPVDTATAVEDRGGGVSPVDTATAVEDLGARRCLLFPPGIFLYILLRRRRKKCVQMNLLLARARLLVETPAPHLRPQLGARSYFYFGDNEWMNRCG